MLRNLLETAEMNFVRLYRKLKHDNRVSDLQELGSHAQVKGSRSESGTVVSLRGLMGHLLHTCTVAFLVFNLSCMFPNLVLRQYSVSE